MTKNQRSALISLSYNLGTYFIPTKTKKLHKALLDGDFDTVCKEMADCNNTTVNGKLVKVSGLTNRRNAEMELFKKK